MNNTKVCVAIAAKSVEELVAKVREAGERADVIEIRFDALDEDDLDTAFTNIASLKPLIATYRATEQGGMSQLNFDQRRSFWTRDVSKFWAIDIEEDLLPLTVNHPNKIVSFHDLTGVPYDLDAIANRLIGSDAQMIKIAVNVNDATDAIPVWSLLANSRKPIIPIAIGECGKWTRILSAAYGSPLAYAALDAGSTTAIGQLALDDLIDIYRVKEITRDTRVYGVIGDPISSSRSPQMHNAAFERGGIDAIFIPIQVQDVDPFFTRMVKRATRAVDLNFAGFAVTMPHKQSVMKHLDELDSAAKAIEAVNTIHIDNGRLIGYNTDAHGFIVPLKRKINDLQDARVAVIGAGGAAKACVYALKSEGADVTVFTRRRENAESLGCKTRDLATINDHGSTTDILVNATPAGMDGHAATLPLTNETLAGVRLVYDLVTRSSDTPLIASAKRLGIDSIDGFEMLVEQGAKQFEIWTGEKAPVDVMRSAAQ